MRGLKLILNRVGEKGAVSHLLQMRGLKQIGIAQMIMKEQSHLLQMRGLKLWKKICPKCLSSRIFYRCVDWNRYAIGLKEETEVASFTDAWIETAVMSRLKDAGLSRIFYRCVDWNTNVNTIKIQGFCRIFYRCVDWNVGKIYINTLPFCRIFYRCVDWN